jgi:hypothetical protein
MCINNIHSLQNKIEKTQESKCVAIPNLTFKSLTEYDNNTITNNGEENQDPVFF